MYYDDELYDDGRHCECGELLDDWGYCPVCDAWMEWIEEDQEETE